MSFNQGILELLRDLRKFSHSIFQKNSTYKNVTLECMDEQPDRELIYICLSLPALVILCLLSLFNRRKSFFRHFNDGKPGLVIPMNSIEMRNNIIPFILAFVAISNLILDIFRKRLGMKFIEFDHIWLKALVKLIVIAIYGLVAYPILAAISQKTLIGYATGILYTTTHFALLIYFLIASLCLPGEAIVYTTLTNLPSLISMMILTIYFGKEILKLKGYLLLNESYVRMDREYRKVRKLLFKRTFKKRIDPLKRPGLLRVILNRLHKKFDYFNYPPRLLCSLAVAFILLYSVVIEVSFMMFPLLQTVIKILEFILPKNNEMDLERIWWEISIASWVQSEAELNRFLHACGFLILFYVKAFRSCFIVSLLLAFFINLLHIPLILLSFSNHFRILSTKGMQQISLEKKSTSPFFLILGFIRYTGYQVGYLVWGFLIQLFVFLLIFSFLTYVIYIPVIYEASPILWYVLEKNYPWIIFTIFFYILQVLMAKFLFTQNFGHTTAIDNRQVFFIWTYISFFYNVFIGLFTGLLRILLSLISGIVSLGRLDFSLLPRPCELMDNGYSNYLGFLFTEQYHNNAVLITFVKLLHQTMEHKEQTRDMISSSYCFSIPPIMSSCDRLNSTEEIVEHRITRARNRWHLALTLSNNIVLINQRKHNLKCNRLEISASEM